MMKKIILILMLLPMMLGFRTFYSSNKWKGLNNSSGASRKLFVRFTESATAVSNDLVAGDPLAESGSTLTVSQLVNSIFDDFNDIDSSWVELVDSSDSDYVEERLISITFNGASGGNAGEAQLKGTTEITGCTIAAESSLLDSAKEFVKTITHELGHCLLLDHPQENTNAIMSYYWDGDDARLQIDDKMGITYLYPVDSAAAKEENTYGLSCARSN